MKKGPAVAIVLVGIAAIFVASIKIGRRTDAAPPPASAPCVTVKWPCPSPPLGSDEINARARALISDPAFRAQAEAVGKSWRDQFAAEINAKTQDVGTTLASGPAHTILTIKSDAAGPTMEAQLEKTGILDRARDVGFKELVLENNLGGRFAWDLTRAR